MRVVGLGNALTDVLIQLKSDACIDEMGLMKGAMKLIDEDKLIKLNNLFADFDISMAGGGSAANCIAGLTRMGLNGGFIGKVGIDSYGSFYRRDLIENGVEQHLMEGDISSGCAMTMISPDGERTFGTYLGAAATLLPADLKKEMFEGYSLLHIEGYLVQGPQLIRHAIELAKKEKLKISLDMASYNVVRYNRDFFEELLANHVDIIFANEEEAFEYTGEEPLEAARILSRLCNIAVVKCGKKGSIVCCDTQEIIVPATPTHCIDSTGAGDLYASGFIYGLSQSYSLEVCAQIGSILAGNVIEVVGTKMNDERWENIYSEVNALLKNRKITR